MATTRAKQVVYIATAQNRDAEMSARIHHHQTRRPDNWITVEEPVDLDQVLKEYDRQNHLILVECLTLWVSNLLCLSDSSVFALKKAALLEQLRQQQCDLILVSNETGLGIVPIGDLTRRFVDESGWLHQDIAQIADRVTLVVAGLPQLLKDTQ
ncbi:MAG: bifunctional adenosylcobinamide kinase/adenosylcobinamide-phosphate guanylyltransferase [Ketobacter sp.]